jgi:Reverse transcriptase (RNA-dependent DNA polymerase)
MSYLSKVIERVAASRFKTLISTHSLFPAQQSTQRSFHSTETAILSVHTDLVRATENGQVTALVLLDLSAAFDTVDHDLLLSVLSKRFSITNTVFDWCQSYLKNRTQSFSFANRISSSFIVSCSVPQGSVLGPLEFEVSTEDIVEVVNKHAAKSHLYIFADDTQLYNSCQPKDIDETRSRLSHCVNDVALWCASRRLKLKTEETDFILFGSRANLKKVKELVCFLQAGFDTIQQSTVVRNLGILFDAELSMKQHVARVAATCFYHLYTLSTPDSSTVRCWGGNATRISADYCNSIIAGVPLNTLEPLQRVQNAAVRLILN